MHWKYKAFAQQIISRLPKSAQINYLGQRHVTKNLPVTLDEFFIRTNIAKSHFEAFARYGGTGKAAGEAVFYEFGAGWDMILQLSFYFLGVNRQTITDVRPLLQRELINHTISRFEMHRSELKQLFGIEVVRPMRLLSEDTPAALKAGYGIEYHAPCDAAATGLAEESVDFISSTYALEHVPEPEMLPILNECRRLLKKGGVLSCRVDYRDHFAGFDRNITVYNFLKYADARWAVYNPPILHQNRLRHKDCVAIAKSAGFELVEETHIPLKESDREELGRVRLDARFREKYSWQELAVQEGSIVLKKS